MTTTVLDDLKRVYNRAWWALLLRALLAIALGVRRPEPRGIVVRAAVPASYPRRDHGTDRRVCDRDGCRAARRGVQAPVARARLGPVERRWGDAWRSSA